MGLALITAGCLRKIRERHGKNATARLLWCHLKALQHNLDLQSQNWLSQRKVSTTQSSGQCVLDVRFAQKKKGNGLPQVAINHDAKRPRGMLNLVAQTTAKPCRSQRNTHTHTQNQTKPRASNPPPRGKKHKKDILILEKAL